MSGHMQSIKIGDATIKVTGRAPVFSVAVECRHSVTTVQVLQPDGGAALDQHEIIELACERALSETPCACIRAVMAAYEGGF